MLKFLSLLSAGIAIGIAASWAVVRSLRKKVALYEAYLHERIEGRCKEALTAMTKKPELMIRAAGKGDHIGYQCSCCGLEFPLADDMMPKEAVIELYHRFREHVEQHHPEASPGPLAPMTAPVD